MQTNVISSNKIKIANSAGKLTPKSKDVPKVAKKQATRRLTETEIQTNLNDQVEVLDHFEPIINEPIKSVPVPIYVKVESKMSWKDYEKKFT
jgi:hypothetical protein